MRRTLVAALISCADKPQKTAARRFLTGLSFDELQFIADFWGAMILERSESCRAPRGAFADFLAGIQERSVPCDELVAEDRDHKLILLQEFLNRCGVRQLSVAGAGR